MVFKEGKSKKNCMKNFDKCFVDVNKVKII